MSDEPVADRASGVRRATRVTKRAKRANFRFGPGKAFDCDADEWKRLRAVVVEITADGNATCPHCGSTNEHGPAPGHRECDCNIGDDYYACPGYTLAVTNQVQYHI